jgi:hypothetical protein
MQNFPSGLQSLFRLSVGSNRACYTRERQHASDHEIASRTSKMKCAFLLGRPFENRHDVDKTLESTKRANCVERIVLY